MKGKTQMKWKILVVLGLILLACASQTVTAMTPLSEDQMESVVGASGFMQSCTGTSNCPGRCVAPTKCTQVITPLTHYCRRDNGTAGCSSSGTFKDCEWAWCLWCSNGGPGRCGNYELPYCESSYGYCTGMAGCSNTGAACKYDCT